MKTFPPARASLFLASSLALSAQAAPKPPAWPGFGGNAQHAASAPAAGAPLNTIHWHTPVDLKPQYDNNSLPIHYASPMISGSGLLLLPVKTSAVGKFQLRALDAGSGTVKWTLASDYVVPQAEWTPSFPAQITPQNQAYIAAAGGTVLLRKNLDSANAPATRLAFYDIGIFKAHQSAMKKNVMIDTPITSDAAGNIFFGFYVQGSNPANLLSGIARLGADGTGSWVSATAAASDKTIRQVAMNCAPALSADGSVVYIAVSNGSAGYLLGLNAATLATQYKVALADPASGKPAWLTDISTASPTVGPDGDVYYGVLENPYPSHNNRGWLLHFDATLKTVKTPGSFGWDDTASLVPASLIPTYKASGPYLLAVKYNNYLNVGHGDGQNKMAVLDPGATQQDEYSTAPVTVMKEVQTILGPTPAPGGGVYEWCFNSAVVDAFTGALFAGNEDGNFYRWDLAGNTLSQRVALNPPLVQAYTPSIIGTDGTVYAINHATLFALKK